MAAPLVSYPPEVVLNPQRAKVFADRYACHDVNGLPTESHVEEMWNRVSIALARPEGHDAVRWAGRFRGLLQDFKFVPGGRIMHAAGSGSRATFYNCYVIPDPPDSREGIFDSVKLMGEIMARGGGVGVNLSSLRPRGSFIKSVHGHSSGPVSWGQLYSTVTGDVISQGGSRRGALMLCLWDWHPDIAEFITSKTPMTRDVLAGGELAPQRPRKLEHANISVCISDAFMTAVTNDLTWDLCFPVLDDPHYKTEWDGDLALWRAKSYPVQVMKTMRARELWRLICTSAWGSAEPGLLFMERMHKEHPGNYFEVIQAVNPCAEEPLPPFGVCNLGSMNLKAYVKDGAFEHDRFSNDVATAVRFLDNAIECSPSFLEENEQVQRASRRIGLGTMGLADTLLLLKVRYGSPASVKVIEEIYANLRDSAYAASISLAREKGSFPAFDPQEHLASPFIERLPIPLKIELTYGLRNSVILTQAPTGTTSLLADASSGIEPIFAWSTGRNDRTGHHVMRHWFYEAWLAQFPGDSMLPLPDYAVVSHELTPLEHLAVQAAVQRYVDTSISKTLNAPASQTIEDVEQLYEEAYHQGCKGVTYYRDGSRDAVLTSLTPVSNVVPSSSTAGDTPLTITLTSPDLTSPSLTSTEEMVKATFEHLQIPHFYQEAPVDTRPPTGWPGLTTPYKVPSRSGDVAKVYITVTSPDQRPREVFVIGNPEDNADHAFIGRSVSHMLRYGVPLDEIIANCWAVRGLTPVWGQGKRPLTCIANAIGQALEDFTAQAQPSTTITREHASQDLQEVSGSLCPGCHEFAVIHESGCERCLNCAYSKCN